MDYSSSALVRRDDASKKWSQKVTTPESGLSQKVTKRPRSSDRTDKKILRNIASFRLPGALLDGVPSVGAPLTPIDAPKTLPTPNNDNHIPVWKFTKDRVKLAFACEALEYLREPGLHPLSWSLNLTTERVAAAMAHSNGFTDYLKRQIDRDLKRAGVDLPYWWFSVDIEGDRLHLHGGMLVSIADVEAIWFALCRAGGDMHGKAGWHQLHIEPLRDHGWSTYAFRNRGRVRAMIGDHTATISQPLRSQAKWIYEQYRQIMRA